MQRDLLEDQTDSLLQSGTTSEPSYSTRVPRGGCVIVHYNTAYCCVKYFERRATRVIKVCIFMECGNIIIRIPRRSGAARDGTPHGLSCSPRGTDETRWARAVINFVISTPSV